MREPRVRMADDGSAAITVIGDGQETFTSDGAATHNL